MQQADCRIAKHRSTIRAGFAFYRSLPLGRGWVEALPAVENRNEASRRPRSAPSAERTRRATCP